VEFNTVDEAQEAYTAMKGQEIDGRQIFVDFAGERGSNNCCEYLTFKVKYTILS
jgi:RNA recognition motif-containing protein